MSSSIHFYYQYDWSQKILLSQLQQKLTLIVYKFGHGFLDTIPTIDIDVSRRQIFVFAPTALLRTVDLP